jgi:probable rRNA maturation factor
LIHIDVYNLQKRVSIDTRVLKAFAEHAAGNIPEVNDRSFTIALISDRRMATLNSTFRGKPDTTDVLSFRHEPDEFDPDTSKLGDIVISAEQAARQADENGLSTEMELKQLILHGILHLCGYDHEADEGEMDARELRLRKLLNVE